MNKGFCDISKAFQFLCILWILFIFVSCQSADKGTLNYSELSFDTSSIAIFKWDTTKHDFPKNSEPLPLKQEDIAVIDSIVQEAVNTYNQKYEPAAGKGGKYDLKELESYKVNLKQYRRQYVPYEDVNGQPIVLIRFFCAVNCYCGEFANWKVQIGTGKIHEAGTCVFRMKVDLNKKDYSDFVMGGYW